MSLRLNKGVQAIKRIENIDLQTSFLMKSEVGGRTQVMIDKKTIATRFEKDRLKHAYLLKIRVFHYGEMR